MRTNIVSEKKHWIPNIGRSCQKQWIANIGRSCQKRRVPNIIRLCQKRWIEKSVSQKRWIPNIEHAKTGRYLLTIDWVMMFSDVE